MRHGNCNSAAASAEKSVRMLAVCIFVCTNKKKYQRSHILREIAAQAILSAGR